MNLDQLYEGAKLLSKYQTTIIIDKIFPEGIYTTGWNLTLKHHDRIFWPMKDVSTLLVEGGWKYIETKISLTVDEIYTKFPQWKGMPIEGATKDMRSDKDIETLNLNKGDKLFHKSKTELWRVVTDVDKEKKLIKMSLFLTEEDDVSPELTHEEVMREYSFNVGVVTKKQIAEKLDLANESLLTIII